MNYIDLSQRKILVTGASSGIGQATAILLAELGCSVVLCGRNEERLEETRNSMKNMCKHQCIVFDVRDFDVYEKVFVQAVSDGHKLDGMVHSAGVGIPVPLRVMNYDSIRNIMDVNYTSFMCLMSMYAKRKYSKGGSVVAISSTNAHYPQNCMSIYAGSKHALEASVKSLAVELVKQGVRINCVIPGGIETPMGDNIEAETLRMIFGKQLLGAGKPEDVANLIVFLLSDRAAFITGRSIYADGGLLGQ